MKKLTIDGNQIVLPTSSIIIEGSVTFAKLKYPVKQVNEKRNRSEKNNTSNTGD